MNDMTETTHEAEEAELTASEAQALAKLNGRKSTRDRVFDVIVEMTDSEIPARAPEIAAITGLSTAIVYDCVKELKKRERIYSDNGMLYACTEHTETQSVSHSWLPNGAVKVEKGDVVLDLNPREARALFSAGAGFAQQAAVVVMDHRISEQQAQIRRLQRRSVTMETALADSIALNERLSKDIEELKQLKRDLGG
ncbi:hypothetical protein [Acidovorax sp. LjRoot117]|uniref:hypothetical protein n=1 Tax=Acidovorax sp. LjRoot117 TaxID=3342255 RepID=UPI003ED07118